MSAQRDDFDAPDRPAPAADTTDDCCSVCREIGGPHGVHAPSPVAVPPQGDDGRHAAATAWCQDDMTMAEVDAFAAGWEAAVARETDLRQRIEALADGWDTDGDARYGHNRIARSTAARALRAALDATGAGQ